MNLSGKVVAWFTGATIVVLIGLIGLGLCTERVKEGHVAVVYTPSAGAKEVLSPGWHVIGLLDKTYEFSVRQEVIKTNVTVNTSDGKVVTIPVTYNLRIDANSALELFKLYGARGEDYYSETVIQQQLQRITKSTIAKYSTIDIFTTKMSEAGNVVGDELTKAVESKGFFINEVALLSPELDSSTQSAIDAQVQAQQDNELKKLELENDKIDQERALNQAKADQAKRKTEADSKAYETKAAANAESYANEVLAKSLTEPVLKKMELEARMAHGWIEIQGAPTILKEGK